MAFGAIVIELIFRHRGGPHMTLQQVRLVNSEMMKYGITQVAVAAAVGVHNTAISHAIAGRKSKSGRIRRMIATMIVAQRLGIEPGAVRESAISREIKKLFNGG
jgi:hypothetical protein